MLKKKRVILRADGSPEIGFGHVYRMIALAQRLKELFDCTFVTHNVPVFLKDELRELNIPVIKVKKIRYAPPDLRKAGQEILFDMADIVSGEEIVAIDGYWFGTAFQRAIKERGCRLVCVDDLAEIRFLCDAVVNHSPAINPKIYNLGKDTKLYTGLEYLFIRKAFYDTEIPRRAREKNVFVSFGGSDPFNYSSKVLETMCDIETEANYHVLYSESFQASNRKKLQRISSLSGNTVFLYHGLRERELISIIDSCTHAITSVSSVCFEVIVRGLRPLTFVTAQNQRLGGEGLLSRQLVASVNDPNLDYERNLRRYLGEGSHFIEFTVPNKLQNIFSEL